MGNLVFSRNAWLAVRTCPAPHCTGVSYVGTHQQTVVYAVPQRPSPYSRLQFCRLCLVVVPKWTSMQSSRNCCLTIRLKGSKNDGEGKTYSTRIPWVSADLSKPLILRATNTHFF